MWISKKMWNEMVSRVSKTERELRYLTDCHEEIKTINFKGEELNTDFAVGYKHKIEKVDTDKAKDVTLQEIARLVMDNEPIVRKTMEEKTNYYGRKVD